MLSSTCISLDVSQKMRCSALNTIYICMTLDVHIMTIDDAKSQIVWNDQTLPIAKYGSGYAKLVRGGSVHCIPVQFATL